MVSVELGMNTLSNQNIQLEKYVDAVVVPPALKDLMFLIITFSIAPLETV